MNLLKNPRENSRDFIPEVRSFPFAYSEPYTKRFFFRLFLFDVFGCDLVPVTNTVGEDIYGNSM